MVIIEGGCLLDGYPELPLTAQMSKPTENEMGWVGSRKVYSSEGHLKKKEKTSSTCEYYDVEGDILFTQHECQHVLYMTFKQDHLKQVLPL